jgi:hypothetical protein
MAFHRVLCISAALGVSMAAVLYGQSKPEEQTAEKMKLSKLRCRSSRRFRPGGRNRRRQGARAGRRQDFCSESFLQIIHKRLRAIRAEIEAGNSPHFVALTSGPRRAPRLALGPGADIYFANANNLVNGGNYRAAQPRTGVAPGDFDVTFALSEAPPRNEKPRRSESCTCSRSQCRIFPRS